jgi:periplasmic divalent cation tolerance protein
MSVWVMLSTAGSVREANRMAEKLVSEKLAACVTVLPGAISHFFWEGKLSREKEAVIIAKTTRGNAGKMINKIKEIHPYQVPEILFFQAGRGEEAYLDWVNKSLAKK